MNASENRRRITAGVDTHSEFHVAAAIDSTTGEELGTETFDAGPAGYKGLLTWLEALGEIGRVGIEGTGMYGAGLNAFLTAGGVETVEVDRPDRQQRNRDGKTDALDAVAAARAVLSGRARNRPKVAEGPSEAVRVTEIVCHSAVQDKTRAINQFKAILVTAPAELRASLDKLTFRKQLERANRFRTDQSDVVQRQVRLALKRLAQRIRFLETQIVELEQHMKDLAAQASPALIGVYGVGPHAAAQLLATVGANPHRLNNEAQFAKLCGVCPIPASSGKTTRHRLNRGGDRRANRALHAIALVRLQYDPRTKAYAKKKYGEGRTRRDVMRCLKRFIAREIFNTITNPPQGLVTGTQLRALRHQKNQTLTQTAHAIGTSINTLSAIEKGKTHNNTHNLNAQQWLNKLN